MSQKNHSFLIDVFSEIKKKDSAAILLLVGKGELEEQLRKKVQLLDLESSVIFAGVRSDIPGVLSAMDVFVFPSFYEGMPNTVIEAQANGLPCIISDTITKEANITGLVEYLPLDAGEAIWADAALMTNSIRENQKKNFMVHGYDIFSIVYDFVKLLFQN